MELVDCHAHLETIDELKIILLRAKEAGVGKIITCGSSIEWSRKCVELAEDGSNLVEIFACCGIHPQDGREEVDKRGVDGCIDKLKELISSSRKVVGVGEAGLDYGQRVENLGSRVKEKEFQRELFKAHIKLADELKKPLVIHCRNAWDELLLILEKNKSSLNKSGMFHSWTGTLADAKRAIGLGFYISFSGIVTFENAEEIVDVAKWAPLDRVLIETDTPFLTPVPFRGKRNEPKNVKIVGKFLADLRGIPFEHLASATTKNAQRLFGI